MPKPDVPSSADRARMSIKRAVNGGMYYRMAHPAHHLRRGRKRPDEGGEAVPADPNHPNRLSCGAAAALELDE